MLKVIHCDKIPLAPLRFVSGLNVLVGDDAGENSIGKSSILLLIDFVFGGDDFLRLASEVIRNVGEVEVLFCLEFEGREHWFRRSTANHGVLIDSNGNFISVSDYRSYLKDRYKFPPESPSFRDCVGLFSRIWGKDNINPNKPLHSVGAEPYDKIKSTVIRLFGYYGELRDLKSLKARAESRDKALKLAFKEGFIKPLTKAEFKESQKRLLGLSQQLDDIKGRLELYAVSVRGLLNDKNLELKKEKDSLLDERRSLQVRLLGVERSLRFGGAVNARFFEKLSDYFPGVNSDRLLEVENFHSGIANILKPEIQAEAQFLKARIAEVDLAVRSIDEKLLEVTRGGERPLEFVEQMLQLSLEHKKVSEQLKYRELKDDLNSELDSLSDAILIKVEAALGEIERDLNDRMAEWIVRFYELDPVVPVLQFKEKSYSFDHRTDTGAGKSYANLISLDLSMLQVTCLPLLIHDTVLFKNIEIHAVERIFSAYACFDKQIFAAIDELVKYNKDTRRLCLERMFLKLDADTPAFGVSWSRKRD